MRLRNLEEKDTPVLYSLFFHEKGITYIDLPVASFAMFERWVNELMATEFLGFSSAKVILDDQEKVAGLILLHSIDMLLKTAEMGTWLGISFRGKGLNEQAKNHMLHYAFYQLGLETIILATSEMNKASINALHKLHYVNLGDPKDYLEMKKQKEFLFQQKFLIYEVRKASFAAYLRNRDFPLDGQLD